MVASETTALTIDSAGRPDASPAVAAAGEIETSPSGKRRLTPAMQGFFKGLEHIGSRFPRAGAVYARIFYAPLLRKEVSLSGLSAGSSVLVIGSGHLPITSIHLARMGFKVHGVDNDPRATESAAKLLARHHSTLPITLGTADGLDIDCTGHDAVWVAFNVTPKKEVLHSVMERIRSGGKVVYRNPRGLLKLLYPAVDAAEIHVESRTSKHLLGKESVILVNHSGCGTCQRKTLCSLEVGCEALIIEGPQCPVLSALGIRPGKMVRNHGRQPFGGPLLASVDGRNLAIDIEIASNIILG